MKLEDATPLRSIPRSIDAPCYNTVRLALSRFPNPVVVELAPLRVEFFLTRKSWVGRSVINGIPLLAWTGFEVPRRALHEPVPCQLNLYHFHAGLLMGSALDHVRVALEIRLTRGPRAPAGSPIVLLKQGDVRI